MNKFLITRCVNNVFTDEKVEDVNLAEIFLDPTVVSVQRIMELPDHMLVCPVCGELYDDHESGKMFCDKCGERYNLT